MTSAAEYQAKVTKSAINMDRLDGLVNGGVDAVIGTDYGPVPSFANLASRFYGWSPLIAAIEDGSRIVLRVVDWSGGPFGAIKPPVGQYIGANGLVSNPDSAVNIRGESFNIDATGLIANRSTYNAQPPGFSYLATDENLIYFRMGSAGNWSTGAPFGKGDKGDKGDDGDASTTIDPETYRVGGMTDQQTLQAALDGVYAAGGGKIMLSRPYTGITGLNVQGGMQIDGNNKQLTCAAGASYVFSCAPGNDNITITRCFFNCVNGNDTTLGCQAITSPTGNNYGYNVIITHNRFVMKPQPTATNRRSQHAVLMNGTQGECSFNYCDSCDGDTYNFNGGFWRVIGNYAANSGDGGIALNNSASGIVANNHLLKCDLGVGCGPSGVFGASKTRLVIHSNVIEKCRFGILLGGFNFSGVDMAEFFDIQSNHVSRCKTAGIQVAGDSTSLNFCGVIANNHVSETGVADYDGSTDTGTGIIVNSARGTRVKNNVIIGASSFGFQFSGSTGVEFDGNSIERCYCPWVWVATLGNNSGHLGHNTYQDCTLRAEQSPAPYPQYIISGERTFTGTLDSSGNATVPVPGLTVNDSRRVEFVFGKYKKVSGATRRLSCDDIDGSNFYLYGGEPNRPYYAKINYLTYEPMGW